MPTFKYKHQCFDIAPKSQAHVSHSDRIENQLSQNVALLLVDKNYESIDNQALRALTSLMKEYLVEMGQEIKNTSEMQGRTESNLIDALNTAYDYEAKQDDIKEYLDREQNLIKSELSLIPSQNHLKVQKQVLQQRAEARMDNIFGKKRSLGNDQEQITAPGEIPDHLKRFRTKDTIPSYFREADSLPDRLAVSDDRTPAAKVVNQSYER